MLSCKIPIRTNRVSALTLARGRFCSLACLVPMSTRVTMAFHSVACSEILHSNSWFTVVTRRILSPVFLSCCSTVYLWNATMIEPLRSVVVLERAKCCSIRLVTAVLPPKASDQRIYRLVLGARRQHDHRSDCKWSPSDFALRP